MIVLPWPDSRLNPNAKRRTHWRVYQPVTKKARADAHNATLEAAGAAMPAIREALAGEGRIPVTVRFYPPDRRRRDDDGMIGSFKAARDGIADALGVDDRRFRPQYFFENPEKPGRIEVVIHSPIPCDRSPDVLENERAGLLLAQRPGPDHNDEVTSHGS